MRTRVTFALGRSAAASRGRSAATAGTAASARRKERRFIGSPPVRRDCRLLQMKIHVARPARFAGWAAAAILLSPTRGASEGAARTAPARAAPVEWLEEGGDCASIERVRQAPPSAWASLGPSPGEPRDRPDTLWVRVRAAGWTVSMPSNRAFVLTIYVDDPDTPE